MSVIYTWLVKTPQLCFLLLHFLLFSSCPLSFYCALTLLLLFLNATNRRLHSLLNSGKRVGCGRPAALSYPSSIVKKRRSSLSSILRLGIQYPCTEEVDLCEINYLGSSLIDFEYCMIKAALAFSMAGPSLKP